MSVDVVSRYANPFLTNGGQEVQEAFLRIYGIDLKKAHCLSMNYLDVQRIN
ncbi:MAG TPA: DUF6140 family protein [Bacteroidales bacterium]|jgi:hypothetical protein|nr:DUF6140 family protein [Bacteroidales bacterium]